MKFKAVCIACLLFALSLLAAPRWASAETPSEEPLAVGDLPAACLAAKADFRPLTEQDVNEAKAQLVGAIGRLDRRLNTAGGEAWRKYLLWDKLQAELNKNKPDPKVLLDLYKRYAADHDGLELVWFLDVRDAIWRYRFCNSMKGEPQFKQGFEAIMDGLAGSLKEYAKNPTPENALAVGEALGPLEDARQVPGLVKAIRRHLVKPNLLLQASANVVAVAMDEEVDETLAIRERILGATVRGTGHTIGTIQSKLSPDDRFAVIDILFFGTTKTKTIASKGPARIHSSGTTRIGACKRLWVSQSGLHSLPAVSNAAMESKFTSIQTVRGGRMMQKMVSKKAYQKKGKAQQVAVQRAEMRANSQIDERSAKLLAEANDTFVNKLCQPMIERRIFPQQLDFHSTPSALKVVSLEATASQLGASGPPPALIENPDFGLQIHESMLNNLAASVLAGRTIREEKLEATLIEIFGKLPDRLKKKEGEDREPWGITFARRLPISVDIADQLVTVVIRGRRYYKGEESYPGMNVTASYKLVKTDKGFKAVRQGDLVIFPPNFKPGTDQLSARQTVIRTLLTRRFGKIFEPEMALEGFTPGGKLEGLGKVEPVQMVGKDGWLTTAWRQTVVK